MPKLSEIQPRARRMGLFVYPGFELLDATGPASVFNAANEAIAQEGRPPAYIITLLSTTGGAIASNTGVTVDTTTLTDPNLTSIHTLLITGANEDEVRRVLRDPVARQWLPRLAQRAVRFGSVCSGAFVLGGLDMIAGRRVASHWSACELLAAAFPAISVDEDAVFVQDGPVWTSAGVTTGIDMALEMVARDLDTGVANDVARRLVLYVRRTASQAQFSSLLRAQAAAENPFGELVHWMRANLHRPLDVAALADRAGLTQRTFFRRFTAAMGQTPARVTQSMRLDAARMLLAQGTSLKVTAGKVGLTSDRLGKMFEREEGVSPSAYRGVHRSRQTGLAEGRR